ncbi:PLDc N-terminal domain-containing protein [Methanosarcina sp. Mfa9]|uniref:PLDc N-terminal domain-containing protein n=1 Tax=Methanosarcina sp. Mfa9 TaxID=3439063 RepID=UPI003F83AFDE
MVLFVVVILTIFIFWITMLVDCLRRPVEYFPSGSEFEKLLWCLVVFFWHPIGAFLYYFLIKRNDQYYAFLKELMDIRNIPGARRE